MPKSSRSHSPPHTSSPKQANGAQKMAAQDEKIMDKVSEIALRKKKNADAQAAFRARRANYIATLEETGSFVSFYVLITFAHQASYRLYVFADRRRSTVTNLEAVVVQLQDSCRESRSEATELRQENARLTGLVETLRHEFREREKYLRALWHARKPSDDPHLDDFPPPPPSFASPLQQPGTASSSLGTPVTTPQHTHAAAYATATAPDNLDPRLQYQAHDSSSVPLSSAAYHEGAGNGYADRYQVFNNNWHQGGGQGASGSDSVTAENGSASHTPAFIPSPTVTSNEVTYGPRYPMMDNHKTVLPSIDSVPYLMNNNDRSISPTTSSPHANSSFPFVFPTESQERNDPDSYRRMAAAAAASGAPELALHGGTADVTYAMNRRRTNTGPDRPMLGTGGMSTFRAVDDPQAVADSRTESASPTGRRSRRNTAQSNAASHSSRSPSPSGHPPISSTLAVIKAQAFGALRRTRTRPKKGSEGAARLAMEVLEQRGIGLGIGTSTSNKRPRLLDDDGQS